MVYVNFMAVTSSIEAFFGAVPALYIKNLNNNLTITMSTIGTFRGTGAGLNEVFAGCRYLVTDGGRLYDPRAS